MAKTYTSLGLDQKVLQEVDKQRRELAIKEGRDISRSSYINGLLEKNLKAEKAG